jgi:hypothetical protein
MTGKPIPQPAAAFMQDRRNLIQGKVLSLRHHSTQKTSIATIKQPIFQSTPASHHPSHVVELAA